MIPPTSIDGTDITGATIDGTDITEITVDGQTVFTAGPPPGAYELDNYTFEKSLDISSDVGNNPFEVTFGDAGAIMCVVAPANDEIVQFTLSTPFDVDTASFDTSLSGFFFPSGAEFNDSGSKFYVTDESPGRIIEHNLTTPFDIGTVGSSTTFNTIDARPRAIHFANAGNKLYLGERDSGLIRELDVSTPFDLSTRTSVNTISAQDQEISGVSLNPSGTRLFESEKIEFIYQYNLSTPFDISTAGSFVKSFSAGSGLALGGHEFSDNGGKLFEVTRNGTEEIRQFTL